MPRVPSHGKTGHLPEHRIVPRVDVYATTSAEHLSAGSVGLARSLPFNDRLRFVLQGCWQGYRGLLCSNHGAAHFSCWWDRFSSSRGTSIRLGSGHGFVHDERSIRSDRFCMVTLLCIWNPSVVLDHAAVSGLVEALLRTRFGFRQFGAWSACSDFEIK